METERRCDNCQVYGCPEKRSLELQFRFPHACEWHTRPGEQVERYRAELWRHHARLSNAAREWVALGEPDMFTPDWYDYQRRYWTLEAEIGAVADALAELEAMMALTNEQIYEALTNEQIYEASKALGGETLGQVPQPYRAFVIMGVYLDRLEGECSRQREEIARLGERCAVCGHCIQSCDGPLCETEGSLPADGLCNIPESVSLRFTPIAEEVPDA